MKKIAIVGGSGFIGSKLSDALLAKGYAVLVVDMAAPRIQNQNLSFVQCDTMRSEIPDSTFEGVYGVVNLAGATIGKRWNGKYKELIWNSRIETTRHVVSAIAKCTTPPSVLVSASAVGYYGNSGSIQVSEESLAGMDYLGRLCSMWEGEACKAETQATRVVRIRTANVLGRGGLLATLQPLFKKNLGAYFGNGNQYMPWVHVEDIVGIYIYALEHDLSGPYNTGAGTTLTQKQLFTAYAQSLGVYGPWMIPGWIAHIMLGEFADALLGGQNTVSKKIADAGYSHAYTEVSSALKDSR